MADGGVEEAQINGKTGSGGGSIEADVISDGGVAVTEAGDESEQIFALPNDGTLKILAEDGCERGQIGFGKRDEAHGGVVVHRAIKLVDTGRVGLDVGEGFDGALGRSEFFELILGIATILRVERRQVIVVGPPSRWNFEHHIGFGFQWTETESPQNVRIVLRIGDILDHDEVGFAGEPFGAADPIKRLGDSGPERRGVFARCKGHAVETPGEQIACDQQAFVEPGGGDAGCGGENATEKSAGTTFLAGGFFRMQLLGGDGDDLSDEGGDGLVVAKDDGISQLNIFWTVGLDDAQHIAPQKQGGLPGDGIPVAGGKVLGSVGEEKTEAAGPVPGLVPIA